MQRFLNLFLSIGLAAACFLGGCKGTGYSKHKVGNKEPLSSEVFLDEPDSMVYTHGKAEKSLSEKQRTEVYEKFDGLMETLEYTDTLKTPFSISKANDFRREYGGVEFRYAQRRKFTGTLPSFSETDYFTWGDLKFDAFLFVPYGGELLAIPYLDDEYIGMDNLFLALSFPQESLAAFWKAVEEAAA